MSFFSYTPYDRSSNIGATLININNSFTSILASLVNSIRALSPNVVTVGGTCTTGTWPSVNVAYTEAIIAGNYNTLSAGPVTVNSGANTVTFIFISSSGVLTAAASVASGGLPLARATNNSGGTGFASLVDIRPVGGLISEPTVTIVTTTPYTALQTDNIVINKLSSPGAATITLPAYPFVGRQVSVKDGTGDSGVNFITVNPGLGASTIDGQSNFIMNSNYEAANFTFTGTEWNVL